MHTCLFFCVTRVLHLQWPNAAYGCQLCWVLVLALRHVHGDGGGVHVNATGWCVRKVDLRLTNSAKRWPHACARYDVRYAS